MGWNNQMAKKKTLKSRPAVNSAAVTQTQPDGLDQFRAGLTSPLFILGLIPLLIFPFIINVRVFPFIAPNEEPKWLLLTLCLVAMGLTAGYSLLKRFSDIQFRLSVSGMFLLAFYVFLAVGVFVGPNIVEGAIRFAFWMAALGVWLSISAAVREDQRFMDWLVWLVSIGSFAFCLRYWWSYFLDFGKPGYNIHVLFSPIGHVNFTGDVLIVLLPALIWMLVTQHHLVQRILNWFSVWTIATILLVASSRGALGAATLTSLVVLVLLIRHRNQFFPIKEKLAGLILPLALAATALVSSAITYVALPYHYRDLARVSATLQGEGDEKGRGVLQLTPGVEQPPLAEIWAKLNPVLGVRTPMFASSTAMALDAPLLGQGTGNFYSVYPGYSNRFPDFRDPLSSARTFTTNPHNIVLQIATQNGFIAMFIFMGLLCALMIGLFIRAWKQWDGWLAIGSGTMLGVLFDAMFNHVFFNPASMFVFALLGGAWWGALKAKEKLADSETEVGHSIAKRGVAFLLPANATKPAAIGLMVITLILAVWPVRWIISEYNAGYGMMYMRQPDVAAMYNQKAYDWDAYNFRAVFGVAQASYQRREYQQCIDYLKHFEAIYPYNPPALNMLGAAYLSSNRVEEAIAAFERTIKILPDFDMAIQNVTRARAILQQQQQQASQAVQSGQFGIPGASSAR